MSEDNSRKATDVLISIESKLEALLNHHKSQDLNLKILSNKLNALIDVLPKTLEAVKEKTQPPKITVEIADSAPQVTRVLPESAMQLENSPIGGRRVSRDSQDEDFKDYDSQSFIKSTSNLIQNLNQPNNTLKSTSDKIIQVTQRVVDKNQKSIFLADVEIKNIDGENLQKVKTNSVGKWSANLNPGQYRVSISKKENASRQKISLSQDISVDDSKSILILSDLVVK